MCWLRPGDSGQACNGALAGMSVLVQRGDRKAPSLSAFSFPDAVAQPGRALDCRLRMQGFESPSRRQIQIPWANWLSHEAFNFGIAGSNPVGIATRNHRGVLLRPPLWRLNSSTGSSDSKSARLISVRWGVQVTLGRPLFSGRSAAW